MPAPCTLPLRYLTHPPISFLVRDASNSLIMEDSADIGGGGTLTSSDFEFSIALSPSSKHSTAQLCTADELFYKGQLLPLHLSPRLSLVRTLLLTSSTSSSEATSTTASRDSNGSSSSADSLGLLHGPESVSESESPRPSSATEEDYSATKRRYFSSFTTRFSSFLLNRGNKKDAAFETNHNAYPSSKKPAAYSSSAKEMIMKYVDKVKPLFEKLASLQHKPGQQQKKKTFSLRRTGGRTELFSSSHSFAGNLRSPCRMKSAASYPSSMRSSPSHSGLLSPDLLSVPTSSSSSMEELQNAIQAAIAHCKSTMVKQKKTMAPVNSFKDDLCVF